MSYTDNSDFYNLIKQFVNNKLINPLEEGYNKYKEWGEGNKEVMNQYPILKQLNQAGDKLDEIMKVPGVDLLMPGLPLTSAYRLTTRPYVTKYSGTKNLSVDMVNSDSPHESIRILRDLLGRAENTGAKNITFTPVSGSSKHTTPMKDMVTTFMNRRNIDIPKWGPSEIKVDELKNLVKRSAMPPVGQEAQDLLGEKVLDIYKKYSGTSHDFDAIQELQQYIQEINPNNTWQKSYDTALELFNLGQAKGALEFKY